MAMISVLVLVLVGAAVAFGQAQEHLTLADLLELVSDKQ